MRLLASALLVDRRFLDCRAMGHAWSHVDDDGHAYSRGVLLRFDRHEVCSRCRSTRRRTVDLVENAVTRRSTKYAPGYLRPGEPRLTRFDALVASPTKETDR